MAMLLLLVLPLALPLVLLIFAAGVAANNTCTIAASVTADAAGSVTFFLHSSSTGESMFLQFGKWSY